jgi:hypothetical protein
VLACQRCTGKCSSAARRLISVEGYIRAVMQNCLVHQSIAALVLGVVIASVAGDSTWAAGLGKSCGGRLGIACHRGLFCDFPIGICGGYPAEGTCVRIPRFCVRSVTLRPVCGCNGKTYPNNCQRQQAIISKRHDGRC